MFKSSPVWRYGAVDIKDDDGSFRHGLIIDLYVCHGFFVDFDCPGHHAELIPFDRCFGQIDPQLAPPGDDVQILRRHSSNEAWRWYPAIKIMGSFDTFVVVESKWDGKIVREVVSLKHGCIMPAGQRHPLQQEQYRKHHLTLGWIIQLLVEIPSEQDFRWWNREHEDKRRILVKVERGKLIHISSFYTDSGWTFWQLVKMFRIMTKRITYKDLRSKKNPPARCCSSNQRWSSKFLQAPKSAALYDCRSFINTVVPVEVLRRIFSFLEFREQLRCRTVCKSWHTILTTPPTCSRMEFSLQKYENDELALIVDRNTSPATGTIVLSGDSCRWNYMYRYYTRSTEPIAMIIGLLKAKHIKLRTIIISHWYASAANVFEFSNSLSLQLQSDWRDVCERLVLENVDVGGWMSIGIEPGSSNWEVSNKRYYDSFQFSRTPVTFDKCVINTHEKELTHSVRELLKTNCRSMEDIRALQSQLDTHPSPKALAYYRY
ncbi:uncharacterized protein LOC129602042 [Paramacrobiotus metropolitanus]|uniref:uncharacterized protein LOC129602042 n=1 Tax=Paramacrobiotus metropolitanus TaxID=2943436 RepID=UPI002445ED8F|nr:uncharacterized protein LOC129602042 [Paramacrobiotus metropolitanus]